MLTSCFQIPRELPASFRRERPAGRVMVIANFHAEDAGVGEKNTRVSHFALSSSLCVCVSFFVLCVCFFCPSVVGRAGYHTAFTLLKVYLWFFGISEPLGISTAICWGIGLSL